MKSAEHPPREHIDMTASMPDPNARQTCELGPLTLTLEGSRWGFSLTNPTEMTMDLPPDYEEFLRKKLRRHFQAGEPQEVAMNLEDLPAISSRHLGLLLSLQKVLSENALRLAVRGASPGVRRLLRLTRTEKFFDFEAGGS